MCEEKVSASMTEGEAAPTKRYVVSGTISKYSTDRYDSVSEALKAVATLVANGYSNVHIRDTELEKDDAW